MAVGLGSVEQLDSVPGIVIGVANAGLTKRSRPDVAIILCEAGTEAACCFTKNRFQAAPIIVAKEHLVKGSCRGLLVNSGNANAGMGELGIQDAKSVCNSLAELIDVESHTVLPFSTGVIGERLPVEQIQQALPGALSATSVNTWVDAAEAIMTTDTVAKGISRSCVIGGAQVTLTGIAKGSGMIRPDMATMLAFLGTDAKVGNDQLQTLLSHAVENSFNRITVDGDTSTNDACVLLATGKSEARLDTDAEMKLFQNLLDDVCAQLAQAIVRDGEGATKFITVQVDGASTVKDADAIAFTVAHSPLVKTALFASDANWGRILMAIGRAPADSLDIRKVCISVNGCRILTGGEVDKSYEDDLGMAAMAEQEILIQIDLGLGGQSATVWTSDLSHEYVRINAEYRS